MTDESPALTLKPTYVGWVFLLRALPFAAFFSFWSGMFFGGMFGTFSHAGNHGVPLSDMHQPIVYMFGTLGFLAVTFYVAIIVRGNYAKTSYRFYSDRIEFEQGFFNIYQKVVHYKDMKEINLSRGVLQQQADLGTMIIASSSFGVMDSTDRFARGGIRITDIPQPQQAYEQIRKLTGI
jgi:uncharacterized membrane protein YdbT with pleckstrin-like domain